MPKNTPPAEIQAFEEAMSRVLCTDDTAFASEDFVKCSTAPTQKRQSASTTENFGGEDTASSNMREIAFIDPAMGATDALITSFGGDVEIVVLNASLDGVVQIAAGVSGERGFDAVHILARGRPGVLKLGSVELTKTSMVTQHANEMAIIQEASSGDTIILICGCNFGQDEKGVSAVQAFAAMTGAGVATSEGYVEERICGGDCGLETPAGADEAHASLTGAWTQAEIAHHRYWRFRHHRRWCDGGTSNSSDQLHCGRRSHNQFRRQLRRARANRNFGTRSRRKLHH